MLVEPLHGVTFAAMNLAAVHYTAQLAPPGLETTAQGLSLMIRNLGTITGTMVAGYIMDSRGSIFLYRAAAALVAATWSLYLVVTLSSHTGVGAGGRLNEKKVA